MEFRPDRRRWLTTAAGLALALPTFPLSAATHRRPFQVYAVLFRGMTDVEKGFEDYLASRKVPVQITYRNLNRDPARMPGFLDEIRAMRPDVVYTWGTSVTLGVVGPYDGVVRGQHITDIPTVFTLVAGPVLAKIVPDMAATGRNVTGVMHVAPTATQIRGMASYRKFETLGVLYTPTERNSVVTVEELRRLGRQSGFHTVERTFRLDSSRKPVVDGAAELVRELKEAGAQWLYLPPDSFLGTVSQDVVIPAAMELGLPTFASTEQLMQAGALCGLVCRYYNIGQLTAYKAEQILVGKVAPNNIPVETLKRFSYQISMPVARRLKLPPPLPMMGYAELITAEAPSQ
ncbi:MAG TPA: ABC transporter substrate-binding protein [Burkholderiales bacterium]|nr:ABC transporter substrate-binding protein [Burkholderiales bacterium]